MGCFKNTTSCGMKLFFKFITTVFMVFYLVILFALTASAATYVVEEGDSLDWISRHFSVSVKSIQNANGLKNDLIHPGQTSFIPDKNYLSQQEQKPPANQTTGLLQPKHHSQASLPAAQQMKQETIFFR
ncbi:MAG: Cell wall hydrolase SleB [Desulfofundulus kuznetsovii]|nr:MAG: Cell wall hydrolase SleB [Desulfofundulus kuznetsovii]